MVEETEGREIPIVDAGEPAAAVLWWRAEESPVAAFAADELQEYVSEMSGGTVPTTEATANGEVETIASALAVVPTSTEAVGATEAVEANETAGAFDGSVSFSSDWLETLDRAVGNKDLDSFAVKTLEDAVVLAGSTHRGTLYGAYEFLKELGVRFFAPEFEFYEGVAEHVPDRESIMVPPLDTVEEPSLTYRRKDLAEGRSHTAETICEMVDWMAKTRLNVLATPADFTNLGLGVVTWDSWREEVVPELEKRGLLLESGGHGFDAFLPPEEYRDAHPEWFIEGCNVFDITDEEAVETYVENTVEYLKAHPEIDIFDAWPPDGAEWPQRVIEEFGSIANAYAHVVNELTAAIRERFEEREIEIEAIAYQSHIEVPDPEYMYDEETIIDFAPFDRSYRDTIFETESESGMNQTYVDLMEAWRETYDGTLSTYEYYRKYSWHSLPVVLPTLIGEEIPFYESIGLDGLWLYSEPADWLTYELTHLLVATLSWDTSLNAEAYVDSYLDERYGPAAKEMKTYLERVETAGRTLYDSFSGNYEDESAISDALAEYRRARETLADARELVREGTSAAFLLERLTRNAEFAIADTEISYYQLQESDEAILRAKQRARELVERHRFDGIVLKSDWALQHSTPEEEIPDAAELIEEYQREWGT